MGVSEPGAPGNGAMNPHHFQPRDDNVPSGHPCHISHFLSNAANKVSVSRVRGYTALLSAETNRTGEI